MSRFPLDIPSSEIFESVINTREKKRFMISSNEFHNIQISTKGIGIEVLYYEITSLRKKKMQTESKTLREIDSFISAKDSDFELCSPDFSPNFLSTLSKLSHKFSWKKNGGLRIEGLGGLNKINLSFSVDGLRFGACLDEIGPVCLGFFVDEMNVTNSKSQLKTLELSGCKPFSLKIGQNLFQIIFAKVDGVIIEFIHRK